MSSGLIVDNITNSVGTPLIQNGVITAAGRPGSILEYLTSRCNGSTVTGISGSYTWPNVTASQTFSQAYTSGYTMVEGSSINYTPPTGTKKVVYEFWTHLSYAGANTPLPQFNIFLNGVAESNLNLSWYSVYDDVWFFRHSFDATDWTTAKTMEIRAALYSTSYPLRVNSTYHWNGAGSYQFVQPNLTIIAIA